VRVDVDRRFRVRFLLIHVQKSRGNL